MHKYKIQYQGGSDTRCKFHLFVVAKGKEYFLSQLYPAGVQPLNLNPGLEYDLVHQVVKIFIQRAINPISGYGKNYSFYFELSDDPLSNLVTMVNPDDNQYFFQAHGRFLRNREVIDMLAEDNPSLEFMKFPQRPGKEELRQMISIQRPKLQIEGGRKIHIRKRSK